MLVLSRKRHERIMIGTDIVVTVLHIGLNVVRIGIDAPRELVIMREELIDSASEAALIATTKPGVLP